MSKMTQERRLRREKRKIQKFNFFLKQRIVKVLFGDEQIDTSTGDKIFYRPDKDPTISNHRRVVGQRITSGRIKGNAITETTDA